MKIEDLLIYAQSKIHKDYARILLGNLLNLNPLELLIHLNEEVEEKKVELYKKEVEALKNNKPLQYVLGYTNFYGNKLIVNESVLIPRFETEELVENTIKYINKLFNKEISIIDLGCGSGAIGLTLKEKLTNINTDVTLVDISEEALEVAKENAKNLNIEVNFLKNDMLENIDKKFDVIISNPPYISYDEEIESIVKDNEPHLALYAKDNGLEFYKKILSTVKKNLKEEFLIAFEIGYTQKDAITNIIKSHLENIEIECLKDMQERDRMIFIYSKNLLK